MSIAEFANIVGLIGVGLLLLSYLLLQLNKIGSNSISYSVLNILGSGFIFYSLFYAWNLPAVVIEICWLSISVFGLIKAINLKFRQKK